MKIAHVVTTLNDTNATSWVTALAQDQLRRGCQVDLIVGRNASPKLIAERQGQGLGVIQIPSLRKYVHPLQEIQALAALYRHFCTERYDIVHTHLAKAGVIGRLAANMARVPRIVHSVYGATFAPTQPWVRRLLFRDLEYLAGRATDAFIFVGKELREAYCRAGVCPPSKGQVIYYGKDLSPFLAITGLSREERLAQRQALGFGEKDIILGNVSRIVPWKGHDYAVEVLRGLKETFPTLKLIIVGDAKTPSEVGFRDRLLQKVNRLGLERDIIFTGWVQDPASYFAVFDLYLLTSMPLEGVPGAVIEAAVAGVPLVGFDCFGVREIPGVLATLVPPQDVTALSKALREKLQCLAEGDGRPSNHQIPDYQERMRRQFDMGNMVKETWGVYQQSWRN